MSKKTAWKPAFKKAVDPEHKLALKQAKKRIDDTKAAYYMALRSLARAKARLSTARTIYLDAMAAHKTLKHSAPLQN